MTEEKKLKPKEKPHYVNNAEFSAAVHDYVKEVREAEKAGKPIPVVTNYIAECFLRINEGLSHKANFVRYTYREEMVMDGVEDCLKRIGNYNLEAKTRTGKPNAFSYFTQISWYAFLRRIDKEKRQERAKFASMFDTGFDQIVQEEIESNPEARQVHAYIEELRSRMDAINMDEKKQKEKKQRKKRTVNVDSDLTDFMVD